MARDDAFLQAICDNPDDDAPRLVYADWLEERGDAARAEFIRVQCRMAHLPPDDPHQRGLRDRVQELLRAHGDAWREELPGWARQDCVFRRGFVEKVTGAAVGFLSSGAAL